MDTAILKTKGPILELGGPTDLGYHVTSLYPKIYKKGEEPIIDEYVKKRQKEDPDKFFRGIKNKDAAFLRTRKDTDLNPNRKRLYITNIKTGHPNYDSINGKFLGLAYESYVDAVVDASKPLPFSDQSLGGVFVAYIGIDKEKQNSMFGELLRTIEDGGILIYEGYPPEFIELFKQNFPNFKIKLISKRTIVAQKQEVASSDMESTSIQENMPNFFRRSRQYR